MIRIGVCDDRQEDLQKIQEYAAWFSERHPDIPMEVEAFSSSYDLLEAVEERGGYDIYLLDMVMPHLNGIETARRIRRREEKAQILFLTVSKEYAVEAFSVKATGYLVKPVEKNDFEKELMFCIHNRAPEENPAVHIKTKGGIYRVHIRDIVAVESFNHRRVFTIADGRTLETSATLASIYEQLGEFSCFFAPHRAYIVNLKYVNGLTATDLIMTDGRRIPVSRKVYSRLKEAYMNYIF